MTHSGSPFMQIVSKVELAFYQLSNDKQKIKKYSAI